MRLGAGERYSTAAVQSWRGGADQVLLIGGHVNAPLFMLFVLSVSRIGRSIKMNEALKESSTRVGVGVMILKEGKCLLARRKGAHGCGEFAFPGGHLEYMESFEQCARRETREECGIEISIPRFLFLANVTTYAPKHYVHVGLVAEWQTGDPRVLEPEKSDSWCWYELEKLPQPIFKMCELSLESYRSGVSYFDITSNSSQAG